MFGRFCKRFIDIAVSLGLLLFTWPIMLLTALCILLEDGFPVIFVQERVGQSGRPFRIMKFRSMKVNQQTVAEIGQIHGTDHHLLLRVGKAIRRLKIDELPQLFNILSGQMSLIGPRPTVQTSIDALEPFQRRRLEAKPGVTGWAQINGNIEVSWADRAHLDVWYIDHWSLWLDIRILVATVWVVVFGEKPNSRVIDEAKAHAERVQRSSSKGPNNAESTA